MKMKGLDMGTASQKSGHKSLLQVNQDRVDECKDRLVMKREWVHQRVGGFSMQHNAYLAISWGSKFKGKQKCTDWGINKTDKRTQKLRCSQSDTSISVSCITHN